MTPEAAIQLISGICYKPGWIITATDNSKRFESSICVHITYPATNSDRSEAPAYNTPIPPNGARAAFTIMCENLDDIGLYYQLAQKILCVEIHEMREFLRISPTWWAPFHPHNSGGIRTWAEMSGIPLDVAIMQDVTFGLV